MLPLCFAFPFRKTPLRAQCSASCDMTVAPVAPLDRSRSARGSRNEFARVSLTVSHQPTALCIDPHAYLFPVIAFIFSHFTISDAICQPFLKNPFQFSQFWKKRFQKRAKSAYGPCVTRSPRGALQDCFQKNPSSSKGLRSPQQRDRHPLAALPSHFRN